MFPCLIDTTKLNIDDYEEPFATHVNKNSGVLGTFPSINYVWGTVIQFPAKGYRCQMFLSKNIMYYRTMENKVWGGWKIVCATSVEDISPAEISSFADTDVSGTINYRVKNGICFVKLWGVKSTKVGKTKFLLNNSSLPIPNCFDVGNALFEANGDGTATAFAFVDANGALIAHFYKANSEAYGSFSYPVAES